MRTWSRMWLELDDEQREAEAGALAICCPFCSEPLASLTAGVVPVGTMCDCGAQVVSLAAGERPATPPGIVAEAYREIRRRVRMVVHGHEGSVERLCIMAARHLHRGGRQRALIRGPSGTGKSTLAMALGDALDCPTLIWDVSTSVEVGWAGVDVNAVFAELYQACDGDLGRMSRALVVCDELDKLAVRDATGVTKQHRLGQAKSLLEILGGTVPIRFREGGDRGRTLAVGTDDMLILGLGVFDRLPSEPTPNDLAAYGFSPEFASRWPVIIELGPLEPDALVAIYRRELAGALESALDFGFRIILPDAVLHYVAKVIVDSGSKVTPRAGFGWLQGAIDVALLRLLDLEACPGTAYTIRGDDVPVPRELRKAASR